MRRRIIYSEALRPKRRGLAASQTGTPGVNCNEMLHPRRSLRIRCGGRITPTPSSASQPEPCPFQPLAQSHRSKVADARLSTHTTAPAAPVRNPMSLLSYSACYDSERFVTWRGLKRHNSQPDAYGPSLRRSLARFRAQAGVFPSKRSPASDWPNPYLLPERKHSLGQTATQSWTALGFDRFL